MIDDAKPEESFLSRWSRLKRSEPKQEPEPPEPEIEAQPDEVPPASPSAEGEPPTDLPDPDLPDPDLPDIETLGRDSDYKPFLASNVPAALKNAALRKLWRSDPVFANLDGLNDYDGDFTIGAGIGEVVETVVKAGRELSNTAKTVLRETESQDGEAKDGETQAEAEIPAEIPVGPPAKSLTPPDADA